LLGDRSPEGKRPAPARHHLGVPIVIDQVEDVEVRELEADEVEMISGGVHVIWRDGTPIVTDWE